MLYELLKTYCMSSYGCVLWNFGCKNINRFYVTLRKAIRRLCKSFNKFMDIELDNSNPCVELARKVASLGNNSIVSKILMLYLEI